MDSPTLLYRITIDIVGTDDLEVASHQTFSFHRVLLQWISSATWAFNPPEEGVSRTSHSAVFHPNLSSTQPPNAPPKKPPAQKGKLVCICILDVL